jgi:hypothetical protein
MVSTNLLHTLQHLPRADKLYVMQFLVSALTQEEGELLQPGLEYPVWSPYDAVEAAHTMLSVLHATEPERHAEC